MNGQPSVETSRSSAWPFSSVVVVADQLTATVAATGRP